MATRTWTASGTNKLWTTGANWSGGVAPTVNDDVIFDGSGSANVYISVMPGYVKCKTLTITAAYTGLFGTYNEFIPSYSTTSSQSVAVYGNITLGSNTYGKPGLAMGNTGTLTVTGGAIDHAFTVHGGVEGEGNATTCTLASNIDFRGVSVNANNCSMQIGTNTVTSSSITTSGSGAIFFSGAGKIVLNPATSGAITHSNLQHLPPIEVTSGTVSINSQTALTQSFHLIAGTLTFNAGLRTNGNMTFNAGTTLNGLGGRLLRCDGNFSAATNLVGASAWTLQVTGTAVVTGARTITRCTASATALDASAAGIDGGFNVNVLFPAPPGVRSRHRDNVDGKPRASGEDRRTTPVGEWRTSGLE